jgi:hypothetical protein
MLYCAVAEYIDLACITRELLANSIDTIRNRIQSLVSETTKPRKSHAVMLTYP